VQRRAFIQSSCRTVAVSSLDQILGATPLRVQFGARVYRSTDGYGQIDEVRSGGSNISQNDLRSHFWLGHASCADFEIRWPSGQGNRLPGLAASQIYTVIERRSVPK
jgi:hypothetical protein